MTQEEGKEGKGDKEGKGKGKEESSLSKAKRGSERFATPEGRVRREERCWATLKKGRDA